MYTRKTQRILSAFLALSIGLSFWPSSPIYAAEPPFSSESGSTSETVSDVLTTSTSEHVDDASVSISESDFGASVALTTEAVSGTGEDLRTENVNSSATTTNSNAESDIITSSNSSVVSEENVDAETTLPADEVLQAATSSRDESVSAVLTSVATDNLARQSGCTYSASTTYSEGDPNQYGAAKAFDGISSIGNLWSSAPVGGSTSEWLRVDFPALTTFNQVKAVENYAATPFVTSFSLEYLPTADSNWVELTNGTSLGDQAVIDFNEVTGVAVRLHFKSWTASPMIREMEVCNVVRVLDKSKLQTLIDDAAELKNNAVAGTDVGNYPQEAIDMFAQAIDAASAALQDSIAQSQIDKAETALQNAIALFEESAVQDTTGHYDVIYDFSIQNGGFEDIDEIITDGNVHYDKTFQWYTYGGGKIIEDPSVAHSGNNCAQLYSVGDTWEQPIDGLKPNTTYIMRAWAKTDPGVNVILQVRNSATSNSLAYITGEDWTFYELEFTTGASTNVRPSFVQWTDKAGVSPANGNCWVDDVSVVPKDEDRAVVYMKTLSDTQTEVRFSGSNASAPAKEDFSTVLTSDKLNTPLAFSIDEIEYAADTHTAILTHSDLSSFSYPFAHTLTLKFRYKEMEKSFVKNVEVSSNGQPFVEPEFDTVVLENGRVSITLKEVPTFPIQADEVKLIRTTLEGETYKEKLFDVVCNGKNISFTFPAQPKQLAASVVNYKIHLRDLICDESLSLEALGDGKTYYVDAVNGDDSNDGFTPDTAWKTLDKVNDTVFYGGDEILFKAGDSWTGQLWPKGSGTDAQHVIKIGMYGEGEKPRFEPGPVEIYDVVHYSTPRANEEFVVGYMIYNQSFLEISNLSLYNPNFESIDPFTTTIMRTGIQVTAGDIGKVEHIYIDDVDIQGFRGEFTNYGKMSGGIIYWVQPDMKEPEYQRPTWFEDLQITNCTIQDVGRSGVNQVTPWAYRQPTADGKWLDGSTNGFGPGYLLGDEYLPARNAYIAHNVFRNIDGDGILVDSFADSTIENNLVDTFVKASHFAAGIFPWLSENVLIQNNEICNGKPGNDAQGCEIDALNNDIIVQYNYMHDNHGGFVQWCTLYGYATYDSHYRYNISEDDNQGYGTITLFDYTYNCSAYNNTVYMDNDITNGFLRCDGHQEITVDLYNNIFYKDGDRYVMSNNKYFTNPNHKDPFYRSIENVFTHSGIKWDNNIFYNFDFGNMSDTAIGTNLINVDPLLKNPGKADNILGAGKTFEALGDFYTIKEGSPALEAGRIAPENGGYDFFGNYVPNDKKPDIGAHQLTVFTPPVNKDNLNEAIDRAEAIDSSLYEELGIDELNKIFDSARKIALDSSATQSDVNYWADLLNEKIGELVRVYAIAVANGTANVQRAAEGAVVTVTATVPQGKEFTEWTSEQISVSNSKDSTTTFVMPANDVSLTAILRDISESGSASDSSSSSSDSSGNSNTSSGDSGNTSSTVTPAVGTPQTGDTSPLLVLAVLLCISTVGMGVMIIYKKQKTHHH